MFVFERPNTIAVGSAPTVQRNARKFIGNSLTKSSADDISIDLIKTISIKAFIHFNGFEFAFNAFVFPLFSDNLSLDLKIQYLSIDLCLSL